MVPNPNNNLAPRVAELRGQGLTDNIIMQELTTEGHNPEQIHMALSGDNDAPPRPESALPESPSFTPPAHASQSAESNIYDRIEEIAESMIDEKWDELIGEVKKIIEWKEKFAEKNTKLTNDLEKLKEDFKTLHQGVLGKLEDYDQQMRDVGVELKSVGKVFKDVVPEFVENVKELSHITGNIKGNKKE